MNRLPCFKKKEAEVAKEKPAGVEFTFYDQHGIIRKGVTTDDGLLHNRDEELNRVLKLENGWKDFSEEDQRVWYLVESGWVRTWLSYVRYGTASLGESLSSPAPPPINNENLLLMAADTTQTPEEEAEENEFLDLKEKKHLLKEASKKLDASDEARLKELKEKRNSKIPAFKWVVRDNLLPANKEGQGHYRRVNCHVWAAFCDMYKGSGPAIRYEDEVPVPEPPPSSEETKPAEGKGSEAEGATTQPPAAATAEAKDGAKKKDKGAGAGEKKEEGGEGGEKKKEGGEGEGEAEGPVLNPTRWQDSKLWVVDQDQARFLAKFSEKVYPDKSEEERMKMMRNVHNSKRLKKDKADKEAEAIAAALAEAEAAAAKEAEEAAAAKAATGEGGKEEVKSDEDNADDNEDGEDEDEEEEGDEDEDEDAKAGLDEALVSAAGGEGDLAAAADAAEATTTTNPLAAASESQGSGL